VADIPHDPAKFAFAAKGMAGEMMAFVTGGQVEYATTDMDWDVVSTVAYFSLEATRDGTIARDGGWRVWDSAKMTRLIEAAHANGSKVVLSLERFAWSSGQTAITRHLLSNQGRRERLAREVAAEVVRRGVDGVNVDFEPIPTGQRDNFTRFMKTLRTELDRVRPGSQLTFCVVGHHESYDVDGATGPDAADAVYLMGYHYAGTWSNNAGSTAPMGGPKHDVVDSVKSLLEQVERHELIVGVPFYGHAWPTAGSGLNARTEGGGFDIIYHRAVALADRHGGAKYDKREQVAWLAYKARPCDGCAMRWFQMYFDDARSLEHKWTWITRNKLLGTGVWTIGFEGGRAGPTAVLRKVLLGE
jgi:spore germination protein YaaH